MWGRLRSGVGGGVCMVKRGVEGYGSRRRRQRETQGKRVSINKQVTPGALELLELPQRDAVVSGIASVKL